MATRVSTGGTKSFHYGKEYNPKLKHEEKQEIRDAYAKHDERKKIQKRNRTITYAIIVVLIIVLILFFLLR